ncbi:MAG: DsrE/DsrF/DrsH-like family protein [Coriobacteriales bacterium]|nr:DsrE/DsrF/DrsH-like family protein [Coriobacteriales bacterium]
MSPGPDVDTTLEQVAAVAAEPSDKPKKLSMVVFSGDMDRLFGAFIIATGAAAMGMEVTMFFTFWGLVALRNGTSTGRTLFGKMLNAMTPKMIEKAHPSKFAFFGMGRWMFNKMMHACGVTPLKELRDLAIQLNVKMYGCGMSMDVMEIPQSAFVEGVQDPVGVGFFLSEAQESQITLFI